MRKSHGINKKADGLRWTFIVLAKVFVFEILEVWLMTHATTKRGVITSALV
jgi:hypothetical protein